MRQADCPMRPQSDKTFQYRKNPRGEEFYIPWDCIQRIGDDIILIDKPFQRRNPAQERQRQRKF